MPSVATLENLQLESSLLGLPAEIKHIIFGLCFDTTRPILDPVAGRPRHDTATIPPTGGLALIQSCRKVYLETDRRPLFAQNTFRFTSVDNAKAFFKSIDSFYASSVHDIEVDVRQVRSDCPEVAHDWLKYLSPGDVSGSDTYRPLSMDAPFIETLRLNFQSWPRLPMSRMDLWKLLRNMLSEIQGHSFKRIVVVGASKGPNMARQEPWSPTHFIGSDSVGQGKLIPWMWGCVKGSSDNKIIRWSRADGRLSLEVVSKSYISQREGGSWVAPTTRTGREEPWPENGSCTLDDYMNRDVDLAEPLMKELNPNADE